MSFMQACFLFFAAWMSGVLNSVAGGGGLIIFPALLVVGVPAISANATSTLASCPGYVASISVYRDELRAQQQLSWLLGSVSLVGGMLGAVLLLHTPASVFDQLVPYLLLIATVLFTFGSSISTFLQIAPRVAAQNSSCFEIKASFVLLLISVYGGFYGLGISFLILAILTIMGIKNIHKMNALKVLMIICTDSFAIVTFVIAGAIAWQHALVMMVGASVGGYSGAYYAHQLKPEWVRRFVIVIAWGITCYFFLRKWL